MLEGRIKLVIKNCKDSEGEGCQKQIIFLIFYVRGEQVLLQIIALAILWSWGIILLISFRKVSLVTVQFERVQMR